MGSLGLALLNPELFLVEKNNPNVRHVDFGDRIVGLEFNGKKLPVNDIDNKYLNNRNVYFVSPVRPKPDTALVDDVIIYLEKMTANYKNFFVLFKRTLLTEAEDFSDGRKDAYMSAGLLPLKETTPNTSGRSRRK